MKKKLHSSNKMLNSIISFQSSFQLIYLIFHLVNLAFTSKLMVTIETEGSQVIHQRGFSFHCLGKTLISSSLKRLLSELVEQTVLYLGRLEQICQRFYVYFVHILDALQSK